MRFDYRAVCGIFIAAGFFVCPMVSAQAAAASSTSNTDTAAVKEDDNSLSATLSRLHQSNTDEQMHEDKGNKDQKEKPDKKAKKDKKAKSEKDRFVTILEDNGFIYALDMKTAHWIPMPHSGNEYIADVWVRLIQKDGENNYSYPQKYYLEHYYIRPKTQQIQFLSELEVTGRPDNALQERPYKNSNWENLVPGSIEDEIYHQVLKHVKKNQLGGSGTHGMSIRDAVEEYLRISL